MRGKRTSNTVGSYTQWLEKKADESDISDKARRWVKNIGREEKLIGYEELPKKLQNSFENGLKTAQKSTRTLLTELYEHADYIYDENGRNLNTKSYIRLNNRATKKTLAHELFHKADNMYGVSSELAQAISKDKGELMEKADRNGGILNYLKMQYPSAFKNERELKEEYRGISDIIHGMSNGKVSLGYGHFQDNYWEKENRLSKETWAQYGGTTYENKKEVLKMFNELFPNISRSAIKQLEEINNGI